ncbi:MAG: hypothetical protein IE931_03500 [Sphingobacteriales bacterium]|nr:hypothetical protein [Sphingobacteriales bacterium]
MKTLATKTSHIAKVRQANQRQKERVCELLGWDESQYCEHQFEVYQKLLNAIHGDCPAIGARLLTSECFRGFFNAQWEKRNREEFLGIVELQDGDWTVTPTGDLVHEVIHSEDDYNYQEYIFIHNTERLMNDEAFLDAYSKIFDLIF